MLLAHFPANKPHGLLIFHEHRLSSKEMFCHILGVQNSVWHVVALVAIC